MISSIVFLIYTYVSDDYGFITKEYPEPNMATCMQVVSNANVSRSTTQISKKANGIVTLFCSEKPAGN